MIIPNKNIRNQFNGIQSFFFLYRIFDTLFDSNSFQNIILYCDKAKYIFVNLKCLNRRRESIWQIEVFVLVDNNVLMFYLYLNFIFWMNRSIYKHILEFNSVIMKHHYPENNHLFFELIWTWNYNSYIQNSKIYLKTTIKNHGQRKEKLHIDIKFDHKPSSYKIFLFRLRISKVISQI